MGSIKKQVIGFVAVAAGTIYGAFTGHWVNPLITGGLAALLHKPEKGLSSRTGHVLENRAGGLERLPVIYGTARVGAVIADLRVDSLSTKRRRLVLVGAYCHGSRNGDGVSAVSEVWFDDRLAVSASTVQPPFNKSIGGESVEALEYEHHLGADDQLVDTRLNDLFPIEWPTESQGRGVCYSRFELWYDNDVYPNGLPRVQAVIAGNLVYDPRDSTWKHSDNPALCIRDYLLSTVYGLSVPEESIDEFSFIDAANYCDALILVPTESGPSVQKRFTLNGWVDQHRPTEQNLAELASACRGQVVNEGSKWRLVIRRQRAMYDYAITADNTRDGSWQFTLPGADSVPNVVRVNYIDPARQYEVDTVQWPEPDGDNPYLDDDNGLENILDVDLPYTQNRLMAQQIAMTLLKEMRQGVGVSVTLKEGAVQCRVGDVVAVTAPTPGWDQKWFDVHALLLAPDGSVQVVLSEYQDSTYELDTQIVQSVVGGTSLPDPFAVEPPGSLNLTSNDQALQTNDGRYIPRIRATWEDSPHPFVDYYEVQAKKTADSEWDTYGRVQSTADPLFFVYPVTDESWDVRIRAVNTLGVVSDWVEETHIVVTQDPRPQILSITLTNAHSDTHADTHSDIAHSDSAHTDSHTDNTHGDLHVDEHGDSASHSDSPHVDSHSDVHGDGDLHMDSHGDSTVHGDGPHGDVHHDAHVDDAHVDSHSDTAHGDTEHSDGHFDAHSDGQHGIGVALQADFDSASIRAVARKHGDVAHADHTDGAHSDTAHTDVTDPTVSEVRNQDAQDGRNVVIELIDVATGAQVVILPGERVKIGALAYSETGGAGVEGPLALGHATLFNVAPVGADMWVPS